MFVKSRKLPPFPRSLQAAAGRSLRKAADWLTANQVRDRWPAWDANAGRFPYHTLIDPVKRAAKPRVLSTCWKTARTAQGLYSAYAATGRPPYLETAERAVRYLKSLQFFDPGHPELHGTFREDSPQGGHVTFRDGVEAIQAFINAYQVTGDKDALLRARLGTDWFLKHYRSPDFMTQFIVPATGRTRHLDLYGGFWLYAGAIVLAQMYALTGTKKYITRGVVPMMNTVCADLVLPSGALGMRAEDIQPGMNMHHFGSRGRLKGVLSNDDGLGVALLCAYKVSGRKKFLEAAEGLADFWIGTDETPDLLAALPSIALFLADVCRLTGDAKYLPRIAELTRTTIEQQYTRSSDPELAGGFIGEDMARHYDKRSKPEDYVDTRITSYAMIHLGKIAAARPSQWTCAYSVFGW